MTRPAFLTGGRLIGAVAVIAVLVSTALAGWWYVSSDDKPITVTAQFDSASGLYEGNVVAVLGMPVGRITKITPRGSYAEVDFTVDRGVKIPADAQAVTVSTSILSERQIELTPPYRGGSVLENHDTIGLTRTKTPVEFGRVLTVLQKVSQSLGGDGHGDGPVAEVLNGGADVVEGNGAHIKQSLDELAKALQMTSADGGAATREQITSIVKNASSLLDAAAANDTKLREFTTSLHQVSQIMADEDIGGGTTGKKFEQLVQRTGELLDANRDSIKKLASSGNTTLKGLVAQQRDLAESIDLAPLVVDNLYNTIDRANGSIRVRVLTDRFLDTQSAKEICNMLGLRQLGCSTGTLQDYGPDFGLTYVLDGMTAMGQK